MGFGPLLRSGIATAKSIVGGPDNLMDDITIQYWEFDNDEYGKSHYSDPVSFQAVVERIQKMVKKTDGQESMATSYIALLETPPDHGSGGDRHEPIDERDIITLSDGTTGPILTITGLMDQSLSRPFLFEIYLG